MLETKPTTDVPSTTLTSRVTLNPAFLIEIKTVHNELWQLLAETKQMCGQMRRSSKWEARFFCCLEELRDLFGMHFALEEGFGYFDDPAHVESQTSSRANALRKDHKHLYLEISAITDWVDEIRHHGSISDSMNMIKLRFNAFCDQLNAHEEKERELIYEAFCEDLGTGD